MVCLLIAATTLEIAPFLDYYRTNEKFFHPDKNIDVLVTGLGLTATTYALSRQLRLKRPHLVVQAGIAGSFKKDISPGEVLVVDQDTIADESVVESGKLRSLFDLELRGLNDFPYTNGWLINSHSQLLSSTGLRKVSGVSVNQVTTSEETRRFYKKKYDPAIESMEGAALHYVCLNEKVPFLQLRAISNTVTERNKKNWRIKESIENLNRELIRLLSML